MHDEYYKLLSSQSILVHIIAFMGMAMAIASSPLRHSLKKWCHVSLYCTVLLSLSLTFVHTASAHQTPQKYVVYMGGSYSDGADDIAVVADRSQHLQLLSSIIPSHEKDRISLIHHYHHVFRGFSALLTEDEASALSGHNDVVSVFPDSILQLHTTRSWDFVEAESGRHFSNPTYQRHISSDVIVGIVDTGIWPESPSFSDEEIGEIPKRWKGVCMEGSDFKRSNCNRKLIGARYYSNTEEKNETKQDGSPRDFGGHGTHTASIAAGARVENVSYHGLAKGTARGGSPSTRLAIYKACSLDGCSGSTILKAIDDAVNDGVDIISISIGLSSSFQSDFLDDPIAIGAFHAQERGVMVVCSAGNDGPHPYTLVNSAPWILTVAASTIDRNFQSTVILGNGYTLQGSSINFSNHSRAYPLAFGKEVAAKFSTPISEVRNCIPGSLDRQKVAGKIIICLNDDINNTRREKKIVVEDAGAVGMILISKEEMSNPFNSGAFPFVEINNVVGNQILKYIMSTKKPVATILPTIDVPHYRPAPVVADFSSRGPGQLTENILKPDVMAPGVGIIAAVIPESQTRNDVASGFAIRSGTSMACPHVSGAAAFIKSIHQGWSSSMIKSALMTTATIKDNMRNPLTNTSHYMANLHEMGTGEINLLRALSPGLVFETKTEDYLRFLCYYGYTEKVIRSISKSKTNFKCPKTSSEKLISNINYPSISISKLGRKTTRKITRTATNVGSPNSTYVAKVHAFSGMVVKVNPMKIIFTKGVAKVSFNVTFNGKEAPNGYNFGYITWSNYAQHLTVRLLFAVNFQ